MAAPIVVVGASAGGVDLLIRLGRALRPDFPAPVCMALHVPSHAVSVLPKLVNHGRGLQASIAQEGARLEPGHLYLAAPDAHLIVRGEQLHLGRGPRENGFRPAIDVLFRSVAVSHGARAIGVVLSGALSDGTAGLLAIKNAGGTAIVQDPEEALYPSMPASALRNVAVDHVVAFEALPELLERLVIHMPSNTKPAAQHGGSVDTPALALEVGVAEHGVAAQGPRETDRLGVPSAYACPDCHGTLWEIEDGDLIRFRCRVGHAYVPDALVDAQAEKLEEALWSAYRALRESAAFAQRLGERARQRNWTKMAESHDDHAREANERARVIEDVLNRGKLGAMTQ